MVYLMVSFGIMHENYILSEIVFQSEWSMQHTACSWGVNIFSFALMKIINKLMNK